MNKKNLSSVDIALVAARLGSKGISQAPYCSDKLFNYIENNKEIDKEINIKRFIK